MKSLFYWKYSFHMYECAERLGLNRGSGSILLCAACLRKLGHSELWDS